MLSTLGRAAVRRVVSRPVAASAVVSRLASRTAADQSSLGWLAASFAKSCAVRSIATSAGEKTTTRKKATAASTKPKTAAAKLKKKPVKKKAAPKPKKKAVRKKKELTPEQKDKLQLKNLKKIALYSEEPKKQLPAHAWVLYVSEQIKGTKHESPDWASKLYTELGQSFKSLSSSEISRLKSVAEENVRKNAVAYKAWVESKTIAEIHEANNARKLLKRKFDFPKNPRRRLIKDDRQPKKNANAFSFYSKARWASGDVPDMKAADVIKSFADEWNALSESEKEPYVELAKVDQKRYQRETEAAQS